MRLDAIVVLGCRVRPDGRLSATATRRVVRAAGAFRQGVAPLLVASGGRRWHGVAEAEALRVALMDQGIPATAIVTEWCSLSTYENARYSAKVLFARGAERVGIVTCDWHMRRALQAFRRAGVEAVPLVAPSIERPLGRMLIRRVRERLSCKLDRFATWGWSRP
jgi:uncharacterized SAM-binding protein YcdF (DUF218 family)